MVVTRFARRNYLPLQYMDGLICTTVLMYVSCMLLSAGSCSYLTEVDLDSHSASPRYFDAQGTVSHEMELTMNFFCKTH